MEIRGQGYLVEYSSYQVKDEDSGKLVDKYKFVFLVGEQDAPKGFIYGASLQTCILDICPLKDLSFMRLVDLKITLRKYMNKIGDRYVEQMKATYVPVKEI